MNTLQLKTILNSDPVMKSFSPDVFALDEMKEHLRKLNKSNNQRGLFICNSETSKQLGAHWFLVFFENLTF